MAAAHGGQLLVSGTVAELLDDHVALRDLGLHRLRDIPAPLKVWQVAPPGLDQVFPPLGSLDAPRSNIRLPRTPLLGRQEDLQALLTALKGAGLLTIIGAGGMGKTRIAVLEAAAGALPDFPGGVWLAELAAVEDAERVADVVLATVGGLRQGGARGLETLAELAMALEVPGCADNCEHVLTVAAECAEAIADSGSSVALATSREPLGVPGEQVFPLSGVDEASSIALFLDRARAVDPIFEVAADDLLKLPGLCRRLDGMPLAIELQPPGFAP